MPEKEEGVVKNDPPNLPKPLKEAESAGTLEPSQKGDEEQVAILAAGIDDIRDEAMERLRDSLRPEESLQATLRTERKLRTMRGNIYNPEVLKNLREQFAEKRVVVVDLDGVIRGYSNREVPNVGALEAILNLKSQGCELVLWTLAMELDPSFFEKCGIIDAFSLIIRKNNFDTMFCNSKDAISSIYEIPWLTEEERAVLSDEYLNNSGRTKPIPLLFTRCTIVEDSTASLPHCLKDPERYRYVYTPTFYGVQGERYAPELWFGPGHIAKIMGGPINRL